MWGQGSGPGWRDRALSELDQILRRPEFQWQEQQPSLLERVWDWLVQQLVNLLPEAAPGGRIITLLIVIAGVASIVILLFFIARRLKREVIPFVEPAPNAEEVGPHTARRAMDHAQNLSEEGDYRQALRYLYLSTLLLLEERGFIRYDRTRTNLEYLQSVVDHPQLAARLREIIEIFERTWYGLHMPDAQTYAKFERQVHSLRELT